MKPGGLVVQLGAVVGVVNLLRGVVISTIIMGVAYTCEGWAVSDDGMTNEGGGRGGGGIEPTTVPLN